VKREPNAFDAAFAAAMLGARMENASLDTLTRVALAALAIAELEAQEHIPEGYYEPLIDRVAERLKGGWPGHARMIIGAAVRDVLANMKERGNE